MFLWTIFVIIGLFTVATQDRVCRPRITEEKTASNNSRTIVCGIPSCSKVSKIIYEKMLTQKWTPVYGGINNTQHYTISTVTGYSLESRTMYSALPDKQLLYIQPLHLDDQGEWRCVVFNAYGDEFKSAAYEIVIFDSLCRPKMTEVKTITFNSITIECGIPGCSNISKIIYEKMLIPNWTPVYRRINNTKHYTLNNVNGYSLENRTRYSALPDKHLLYIQPLRLDDQGEWRCVVFNAYEKEYTSAAYKIEVLDSVCRPRITEDKTATYNSRTIECGIPSCSKISKIIYEKMLIQKWTPVYGGTNYTQHNNLNTVNGYSLENRTMYSSFPDKHLLYIRPLRLDDQGEWRCLVFNSYGEEYISASYEVVVKPNITITQKFAELEFDQYQHYTCEVDGIYTEPSVFWRVNNATERLHGEANNTQHKNGLWHIENTIKQQCFMNILSCVMETEGGKSFLQKDVTLNVTKHIQVEPNTNITITQKLAEQEFEKYQQYTCEVDGTDTEPLVFWRVNNATEPLHGEANNTQHRNCLWHIRNTIKLPFQKFCIHILSCVMETKSGIPFLQKNITINVTKHSKDDEQLVNYTVEMIIGFVLLSVAVVMVLLLVVYILRKKTTQETDINGTTEQHS